MALDQERGSAVANALHRGWEGSWPRGLKGHWEHIADRAILVPVGLDRNLNTWMGIFGPVPLLSHGTGHHELLTVCKLLPLLTPAVGFLDLRHTYTWT